MLSALSRGWGKGWMHIVAVVGACGQALLETTLSDPTPRSRPPCHPPFVASPHREPDNRFARSYPRPATEHVVRQVSEWISVVEVVLPQPDTKTQQPLHADQTTPVGQVGSLEGSKIRRATAHRPKPMNENGRPERGTVPRQHPRQGQLCSRSSEGAAGEAISRLRLGCRGQR